MLGKAEYVKYVLRSVCEERIKIFLSEKFITKELTQEIVNQKTPIDLIDELSLYQKFIEQIPSDLRDLYRFGAFVSDNIGKVKKDKFDIKKFDNTAEKHAQEFKKSEKAKLKYFEEVPGEWHLQELFIKEVEILRELIQ